MSVVPKVIKLQARVRGFLVRRDGDVWSGAQFPWPHNRGEVVVALPLPVHAVSKGGETQKRGARASELDPNVVREAMQVMQKMLASLDASLETVEESPSAPGPFGSVSTSFTLNHLKLTRNWMLGSRNAEALAP